MSDVTIKDTTAPTFDQGSLDERTYLADGGVIDGYGLIMSDELGSSVTATDQCNDQYGEDTTITFCDEYLDHPTTEGIQIHRHFFADDGCGNYAKDLKQVVNVIDTCAFDVTTSHSGETDFSSTVRVTNNPATVDADVGESKPHSITITVTNLDGINESTGLACLGDLRGVFFDIEGGVFDDPLHGDTYINNIVVELESWVNNEGERLKGDSTLPIKFDCDPAKIDRLANDVTMKGTGKKFTCGAEVSFILFLQTIVTQNHLPFLLTQLCLSPISNNFRLAHQERPRMMSSL